MKLRIFSILFALLLVVGIGLIMSAPATANGGINWYVATTGNDTTGDGSLGNPWATIGYALTQATSGDTVHVAAGTYTENITLVDGVDVLGAGAGSSIIDGNSNGAVVTADTITSATTFSGFTIQNGSGYGTPSQSYGGGMYVTDSSALTVSNCTFSGNAATYAGGGMYTSNSSITVTSCAFNSNSATNGGGMYNDNASSPTVDTCTFTGNTASLYGGGMGNSNASSPTLTGCTFTDNSGTNGGGGIANMNASNAQLTNCDFNTNQSPYGAGMFNWSSSPTLNTCNFTGNTAATHGGGMYSGRMMSGDPVSRPTLTDCTFTDNTAGNYGGGMYNTDATLTLNTCTFTSNSATNGGGGMRNNDASATLNTCTFTTNSVSESGGGIDIYASGSQTLAANGCTFDGNTAGSNGGGIRNFGSYMEITECTFTNNDALWNGGGIDDGGPVSGSEISGCFFTGNDAAYGGGLSLYSTAQTVTDCTFLSNTATYASGQSYGGGLYTSGSSSPPTVINSVFALNEADWGGGVCNNESSTPTLVNCTFYGNTANYFGGGIVNVNSSSPTVTNCILWADSPQEIYDYFGSTSTVSYCDIQGGYGGTGNINSDPLFVDAAGGNLTLQGGSPGVDAGDNDAVPVGVTTDIEGYPRFIDGNGDGTATVDMGAYETVTEVWVDNDYCDVCDNDGHTWGVDAFATVQDGVDAAATGGTVNVHPGKYTEVVTITDKSLTVESVSGDWHDTIIDEPGWVIGLVGESDTPFGGEVTISGFTLTASYYGVSLPYGLTADGAVSVSNCLIHDNESAGIYAPGTLEGDIFIDDCIIADNGTLETGIHLGAISGTVEITDSVVGAYWDATTSTAYDGNVGNGILIDAIDTTGSVLIDNNIIGDNAGSGIADGITGCAGQLTIINNVIGAYDYDPASEDGNVGGNGDDGIYIDYIRPTGTVIIEANAISENATGIRVEGVGGGSLFILDNTIRANVEELSGIHIDSASDASTIKVNLNNIFDNSGSGVYYYYDGADSLENIDATNNWWGATDGPSGEGSGSGDEVSSHVTYDPWLGVTVDNAKAGTITDGALDNVAAAGVEVVVTGGATVTSANYSADPSTTSFSGDIGKYIDVCLNDASGVTSIQIRLYYTDAEIAGLDESTLSLNWWNGTAWVACSNSGVNTEASGDYSGYIWANITAETTPNLTQMTGSVFGGSGSEPSSGPQVPYSDTNAPRIANVMTCSDGVSETTADICWQTSEQSTSQVEYWDSSSLLSPLDTSYVTEHHVQLTDLTPGTTYYYQTMSEDRAGNLGISEVYSFTTLGEAPAAVFTTSDLSVSPAEVESGEAVTVTVLVTNSGELSGSYTVTLRIDGVTEASEEIVLDNGASQTVSFTVSREAAGSYSVAINSLSSSFTVTEAENEPDDEVLIDEEPSSNWPLIWGIIGGVVVIALIVLVLTMRRRGK